MKLAPKKFIMLGSWAMNWIINCCFWFTVLKRLRAFAFDQTSSSPQIVFGLHVCIFGFRYFTQIVFGLQFWRDWEKRKSSSYIEESKDGGKVLLYLARSLTCVRVFFSLINYNIYLNNADVKNCGDVRSFGFMCVYIISYHNIIYNKSWA